MNEATLNSIHSGFQTVNDTLMRAQKIWVVGAFASVAQFFVSMAELATSAALAPVRRNSEKNIIEDPRDAAFKAHKYDLATEGLDGLVTSVINVATLGFFVPIMDRLFPAQVEEVYTPPKVPPHEPDSPEAPKAIKKYQVHPLEGKSVNEFINATSLRYESPNF